MSSLDTSLDLAGFLITLPTFLVRWSTLSADMLRYIKLVVAVDVSKGSLKEETFTRAGSRLLIQTSLLSFSIFTPTLLGIQLINSLCSCWA